MVNNFCEEFCNETTKYDLLSINQKSIIFLQFFIILILKWMIQSFQRSITKLCEIGITGERRRKTNVVRKFSHYHNRQFMKRHRQLHFVGVFTPLTYQRIWFASHSTSPFQLSHHTLLHCRHTCTRPQFKMLAKHSSASL